MTGTVSISSYHNMYTFYLLLSFLFKHDYADHVANVVKDFSVRNNFKRRQIDINVYSTHLLMSIGHLFKHHFSLTMSGEKIV